MPTDVAAGLVLVQKQQLDSDSQLGSVVTSGSSTAGQPIVVRPDNAVPEPKPWMTVSCLCLYGVRKPLYSLQTLDECMLFLFISYPQNPCTIYKPCMTVVCVYLVSTQPLYSLQTMDD